jgi:hypothetical protein
VPAYVYKNLRWLKTVFSAKASQRNKLNVKRLEHFRTFLRRMCKKTSLFSASHTKFVYKQFAATIACLIYEPPFTLLRENISEIPEILRRFFLFTDFDTKVIINGILGFLENSTGEYLAETIESFCL